MINNYSNLERDIFDSKLVRYECLVLNGGDNYDLFIDNSKVVNGVNLYKKFLDDYYFRKLDDAFGNYSYRVCAPKIVVMQNDQGSKVKFSIVHFMTDVLRSLIFPSFVAKELGTYEKIEELETDFKEILRNERKRLTDVLKNKENSPYYEEFKRSREKSLYTPNDSVSDEQLIETAIEGLTAYITSFKYVKEIFDTEIDYHELMNMFDPDKFYLCIAKSAVDMTLDIKNINGEEVDVDPTFIVCSLYSEEVERMKLFNPNYNVTIKVGNKHYKSDDVKKFVDNILSSHENLRVVNLTEEEANHKMLMYHSKSDIEKMTRSEYTESLMAIITSNSADSEYLAGWEILPKGESVSYSEPKIREKTSACVYDEQMDILIKSREYIENTDYRFKLFGKGDFEGYVAFIYSTGTVILEKNNDRFTKDHNTIYNATYVMNYQNFMEFSMMSKTSIIEGIKSGKLVGVRRIFHTKNFDGWASKVDSAINASEYTEDVLKYINHLIRENQITKKAE